MTTTEIGLVIGFCSLVVGHVAAYVKAQSWIPKLMESLVADLRKEHAACREEVLFYRKELDKIRAILLDITPVADNEEPAE
jgi:hypothetical protein